jgi:catechol 2,3-dioxygenase
MSAISPSSTATAQSPAEFFSLGPAELRVTDVERAMRFWTQLIGLQPLGGDDDAPAVGSDGRPVIALRQPALRPAAVGHAGLYHVAVHFSSELEFARALARLTDARWPISSVDHLFSQAIYLRDPDGIGVELTLETPWRMREMVTDPVHGLHAIDHEGRVHRPSEPLDVEALIALVERDGAATSAQDAYIGHIHLSVPDVDAANAFYRDRLGMISHMHAPELGFADLHAGGAFMHRIALNSFCGPGARPAPGDTAGMDRYTIRFDSTARLEQVIARLGEAKLPVQVDGAAGAHVRDPAGVLVDLTTEAGAQ